MRKKIAFIISIFISLALLLVVLNLAFPQLQDRFLGKKVSKIQIADEQTISSLEQFPKAVEENQADIPVENKAGNSDVASKPVGSVRDNSDVAPKKDNPSSSKSDSAGGLVGTIIDRLVSFGFQVASGRKIDTIVIHSNYNKTNNDPYDVSGCISQFKIYGVAAHYLIDRKGNIYRLVDEKNIAWHAGVSKMADGRTNVNDFSIGIEIITKDSGDSPTTEQYGALNSLIAGIKKRQSIKYVLGHSDIAPGRKNDPWGFDWNKIQK